MTPMRAPLIAACVSVFAAGCISSFVDAPKATADLLPTKGSSVRGTANFVQLGERVRLTASISGLKPNSEFGFHIHEAGDCSSGDGMSAKGHFNPLGKPHAYAETTERHAGDLPSLKANANGHATLVEELDVITVTPGPTSVVGRGLIVHAQPDDFKTQPTGNAGARSACAEIKAVVDVPKEPAKAAPKPPPKEPAKPAAEPAKPAAS